MSRWLRLATAVLMGLLASCSEDDVPLTQIVVVIDSDFSGITRLEADVRGFEEPSTVEVDDLDDEPLPRRFSLVHDGGELGPMSVTVRAYTADSEEPILVEPRTDMFFEPGKTLLLKIDLLAACVPLDCPEACVAPGECVSSKDAAELLPWSGDPDPLDVGGPYDAGMDGGMMNMPDGSMDEGGTNDDAGDDAGPLPDADVPEDAEVDPDASDVEPDAEVDAGADAMVPEPTWPYVPSNVDTDEDGPLAGLNRIDVVLDCGETTIDSTIPTPTNFCNGTPAAVFYDQDGAGGEVMVVVMSSLQIDEGSTLYLTGSRPIVLLVEGDAIIDGTIDASASGATGGAGADDAVCAASVGVIGNSAPPSGLAGASGGGGGGFGSPGSASGSSSTAASAAGGAASGEATLVPLRAGCRGGQGGVGRSVATRGAFGGGGGAMQLSVAGTLTLNGVLRAAGAGGAAGDGNQAGGGGGGSGGAILIEADVLAIDSNAVIAANGGAGGGGQPSSSTDSTPGEDGSASTMPAAAGFGASSGGDGGRGAALGGHPTNGMGGSNSCGLCPFGGGGGGAGGVGRIRLRGATSCEVPGILSPAPSIDCSDCGSPCAAPPDFTCRPRSFDSKLYQVCSGAQTWGAARALCQGSMLDLVKVDSADEDAFVDTESPNDTWIGAYDLNDDDDWRWSAGDVAFWSGDEGGDPVGMAHESWRSGEPNDTGDCARTTVDGWADTDCESLYPFVCE